MSDARPREVVISIPDESPTSHSAKRKLRIAIVSENLMPKVDGVTRCLARLLAHLREEGHEAVVLGPQSGMTHYETYPLVGTAGIPLVLYPGLKLNFLRPKFLRIIREFNPDVIHIVEPIWLGAQVLIAMQLGWCGKEWTADNHPGLGRGVGGPVVASYHTNLPTYASLFGFPWAEPIMWRFVRWLHGKVLLTACPSNSTAEMLKSRGFSTLRIWSRGVDLSLFGSHRRSSRRRASWGVDFIPDRERLYDYSPDVATMLSKGVIPPLTPPPSPDLLPVEMQLRMNEGTVVLYVGRISYEKNLVMLIRAFDLLQRAAPTDVPEPKLVLVGDGPARSQLEQMCREMNIKAVFEGHLSGERLAESYASADVFAFPSYTETFGQVVLEALASGLPVVGLDAEGTQDLVKDGRTGYLLSKPAGLEWKIGLADSSSQVFQTATENFSILLQNVVFDRKTQGIMRRRAMEEGAEGHTWFDAMEAMVNHYREAIEMAKEREGAATPPRHSPVADFVRRCAVGVAAVVGVVVLTLLLL